MRTIILVIASALLAYGQNPTSAAPTTPAAPAAAPAPAKPQSINLVPEDNLRLENIQLRIENLNKDLSILFGRYCTILGANSLEECEPIPPTQANRSYSVRLKPVAPAPTAPPPPARP